MSEQYRDRLAEQVRDALGEHDDPTRPVIVLVAALRAALAQERSDCAKLRAFAQDCEALWLNGGVDVLSLGDMLQRHKLISGPTGNPIVLLSGRGEGR